MSCGSKGKSLAMLKATYNQSDAYREQVLIDVRQSLREHSRKMSRGLVVAEAKPAFARGRSTYYTRDEDEVAARRDKLARQALALRQGYYSPPGKPYQSMGHVVTEEGDIVLDGVLDAVKPVIKVKPFDEFHVDKVFGSGPSVHKKRVNRATNVDLARAGPDLTYRTVKSYLNELRPVLAVAKFDRACLGNEVLELKKRRARPQKRRLGRFEMQPIGPKPSNELAPRSLSRLTLQRKEKIQQQMLRPTNKEVHRAISQISDMFDSEEKNLDESKLKKLKELEIKQAQLQEYRQKNQRKYRYKKLHYINLLLCAITNMKPRLIKTKVPLKKKMIRNLFYSDISLDPAGKPVPCKHVSTVALYDSDDDEEGKRPVNLNVSESRIDFASSVNKRSPLQASSKNINTLRNKMSSKQFNSHQVARQSVVQTWEDLLNVIPGSPRRKQIPSSTPSKASRTKFVSSNKEEEKIFNSQQQWLHVEFVQQHFLRKRVTQSKLSKSNPWASLTSIKERFDYAKKQNFTELEEELNSRKSDQFTMMRFKLNSLRVGAVEQENISNMRSEAYKRRERLKLQQKQPQQWFVELETEMNELLGKSDRKMQKLLSLVRRFQYEDSSSFPNGKEKLCLIFMSMPLYVLMAQNMMDSMDFVLTRVLDGVEELVDVWLKVRKIHQLSQTMHLVASNG